MYYDKSRLLYVNVSILSYDWLGVFSDKMLANAISTVAGGGGFRNTGGGENNTRRGVNTSAFLKGPQKW